MIVFLLLCALFGLLIMPPWLMWYHFDRMQNDPAYRKAYNEWNSRR